MQKHFCLSLAAITIAGPAARTPAARFEEFGRAFIREAGEVARRFLE